MGPQCHGRRPGTAGAPEEAVCAPAADATVHLPHRVAAGLHGSWITDTPRHTGAS
ncbi:hypothetical protein [Streptomyces sp. NRRL F-2664]|uniref:hypothetical protein n=1 Tax=Streptomyces sp. NRRL F-2664 TaxID=1463842 RepID=UPI000ACE9180|nr:hypothetical protein [Streptomyces sp. NRRL F-2664]